MKRFAVIGALIFGAAEIGAFGCNAILGNEDGKLLADASTSALTCAANQKACGACVDTTDPKVGCGGECTVCPTPSNGQAGCQLENNVQTCDLGSCNPQFDNCNGDASDGCETHTTTKDNCGSCGASCGDKPFCEPTADGGAGYTCSNTCDKPNMECTGASGAECINPKTDNQNCGGCGNNCTVQNGSGTCDAGSCQITCNANTFLCSGECVAPTNAQCGASCTVCGMGTHCDKITGDPNYGTCVTNGGGGGTDAGCASNLMCAGACCSVGQYCCGAQCSDESDNACGSNCDKCNNGATCKPTAHACACAAMNSRLCADNGMPTNHWCCPDSNACGVAPGQCIPPVTCLPGCKTPTPCCCPGGGGGGSGNLDAGVLPTSSCSAAVDEAGTCASGCN